MHRPGKIERSRTETLARFLSVLSNQIAVTACEIADLGRIVAADRLIADRRSMARKLEVFDLLKQKCATNAELVRLAAGNFSESGTAAMEALEREITEKTSGAVRDELLDALQKRA